MKTPPDRAGITFAVGAQLEARDKHNKWYSGRIQQLDTENQQVLVQYRRWSKRYQEWFHWDSPHIRGLDRVSLRKQGLDKTGQKPLYSVGSKVMACWTDCKFYPAKILRVNKDDSYTVRFFDGVIRTVRPTKIKPYDEKWKLDNSSEEWDSDSEVEKEGEKKLAEKEENEDIGEEAKKYSGETDTGGDKTKEDIGDKDLGDKDLGDKDLGDKGIEDKVVADRDEKLDSEKNIVKEEHNQENLPELNENKKEVPEDERKEPAADDQGGKEAGSKEDETKEGRTRDAGERQRKRRAELLTTARAKRKRIRERNSTQEATSINQDQPITGDHIVQGPTPIDREVLLERQAHLPTTHKFSREPLYRVIKRQPPPILSIELDHNEFKCPAPNCTKSFRKSSLLHCHLKYYHSTAVQSTTVTTARERKRLSSEGISDASESKLDLGTCRHGDEETVPVETGPKTDPSKTTRRERIRDRKHFLRVKLKKKKKKKKKKKRRSHTVFCSSEDEHMDHPSVPNNLDPPRPGTSPPRPGAEEGSDWSTLTAESGEDTPTWPVSIETESDVVRCVCEVNEESDFMIQCDQCQCWQHGTCLGLLEHHLPQSYTCFTCRGSAQTPIRSRDRRKLCSDWLTDGHMFGLSCLEENFSEQNSEQIAHTRRLLAHSHTIATVAAAIGLKLRLLQTGSEAELQFWRLPWRREEGEEPKVVCYVSSEHCYQKPALTQASPEEFKVEPDQDHRPAQPSETCTSPELNLLDHIESLQQEICHRLERMETELDGLESWMDELESADPLPRLPELKQRIRRLLRDLSTLRQLSVSS
ncbi:PHD finger protein 20-like protein 1 isoform X2 [Boleophthalmus pectinirostris]|uniref:PHD finger protein 20-like protein 1 isoform X2 n=1 Tax=Boleophthalmus pectinirostris TaxID=150288 RepID=UPI00242DF4B8|nr:PHD finger protein 20-like protein 1 isoform X2 [Boleophthalmus pectinirostris]